MQYIAEVGTKTELLKTKLEGKSVQSDFVTGGECALLLFCEGLCLV